MGGLEASMADMDAEGCEVPARAAKAGKLSLAYRTPTGTVVADIAMDRWDELHDRLEAAGLCPAWTPEMQRRHRQVMANDQTRRQK